MKFGLTLGALLLASLLVAGTLPVAAQDASGEPDLPTVVTSSGDFQLGSADLQSLADLTSSVNVVLGMRPVPASLRLMLELGASVILPLLPLVFLKYPVDQVAARLFRMLTGL